MMGVSQHRMEQTDERPKTGRVRTVEEIVDQSLDYVRDHMAERRKGGLPYVLETQANERIYAELITFLCEARGIDPAPLIERFHKGIKGVLSEYDEDLRLPDLTSASPPPSDPYTESS